MQEKNGNDLAARYRKNSSGHGFWTGMLPEMIKTYFLRVSELNQTSGDCVFIDCKKPYSHETGSNAY